MIPVAAYEEIEALRAEVAFLKQELGLTRRQEAISLLQDALRLTRIEAEVVFLLHRRSPNFVHRERIFEAVWGGDSDVGIKIVDVYVCKIRKKLGGYDAVHTLWGRGYRLGEEVAQRVKELLDKVPS